MFVVAIGTPEGLGGHKELPKAGETVSIGSDWWMLVDEKTTEIKLKQLNIFGTLEVDGDHSADHVIQADIIFISGGNYNLLLPVKMKLLSFCFSSMNRDGLFCCVNVTPI